MSNINLELTGVSKRFGGNQAVNNVSFTIDKPELVGVIGPNGAGKTTLTNMMSGMLKPSSGTIYLGSAFLNTVGISLYRIAYECISLLRTKHLRYL